LGSPEARAARRAGDGGDVRHYSIPAFRSLHALLYLNLPLVDTYRAHARLAAKRLPVRTSVLSETPPYAGTADRAYHPWLCRHEERG
jgi:hypothetical protein